MADNTTLNSGSGGDVIATDDDGTAKHQQVKVEWGRQGAFNPVTEATALPVQMTKNYKVEVPAGNVTGVTSVNKFGRSTNVDSGIDTDIHDQANASDDIDIWVAPTQARTHQIASTSSDDDGSPVGAGARTIRVFGLTDWDTAEVSEDITMNGTSNVATSNSYVIIHRMRVLTKGATSSNVGTITATADTDGTITAQIGAGNGQTLMAVYGIPSVQTGYMTNYWASFNKSGGGSGRVDVSLLSNPEPDSELTNFLVKNTQSILDKANSQFQFNFNPYFKIPGPAIVKVQGNGSTNNLDVSAGFDIILVTN